MSSYFADEDNITFGVQGSNAIEIAQFSSTLDEVVVRFFTNNGLPTDNLVTGAIIGSSNFDKSASRHNDLYFGRVTDTSNVERIMTIRDTTVGINTSVPSATFHVVGSNLLPATDLTRLSKVDGNGVHTPCFVVNHAGEVGFGTNAVSGQAVTISGTTRVSQSLLAESNVTASNVMFATNISPVTGTSIQFSGSTLSNIALVRADKVHVSTVLGTGALNTIDMSSTDLSNVGDINMDSTAVLYTNNISTVAPAQEINFNNKSIFNVNSLSVNGDIKVRGEFFVTNTTTCNTQQLSIDNDNTGPALIVNQRGFENIAHFMDDSNVVMFIKDGGQTAFGSFGNQPDTQIVTGLVHIQNPSASNQTALHINQQNSMYNRLTLNGPLCNVVVTGDGKLGMGTAAPLARMHAVHMANDSTDFLRLTSGTNPALVVTSDSKLGVGTYPVGTNSVVSVHGAIETDDFVKAVGLTAFTGTTLNFNSNTASNIAVAKVEQLQATHTGSAVSPAITFESDTDTGLFQPAGASNSLAIATAGVERLRVTPEGNVGIGTTYAPVPLYVNDVTAIRIPVGQTSERPAAGTGMIRFNTTTSTFEGYGNNTWGSLGGVKDVNGDTYISAEDVPGSNNDELKFFTSNIQRMYIGGPLEDGNVGIGTTVARVRLDIDTGTLRAARVQVNKLSSTQDVIDCDYKSLSNIFNTRTDELVVAKVSSLGSNGVIDIQGSTLSNINGVVDVSVVDTRVLTCTRADAIDLTNVGLSNISVAKMSGLQVSTVTTIADGCNINISGNNLSNIGVLARVGVIDVGSILNTQRDTIDINGITLSNITATKTQLLQVDKLSTLAPGGLVDVQNFSLSNISILAKVGTLDAAQLTNSQGGIIDVTSNTLSNISVLSKVGTADISILTNTERDAIDCSAKTLSNLAETQTASLQVSRISTLAPEGLINMQGFSLSNVSLLSKVGTLDAGIITNTLRDTIDVSGKTLSNLAVTKTSTLEVSSITTLAPENLINVQGCSLSNVTLLSKVGTIDVGAITNSLRDTIDVTGRTLSNITTTKTQSLEVTDISTLAPGGLINLQGFSLSNISVLSKVSTADVAMLTCSTTCNINVDFKTLSNISSVITETLRVSTITGSVVDCTTISLSNLGDVHVAAGYKLYTDSITSASGLSNNNINFNGNNIVNVNDVRVNGSITVNGEFFVMDTTTCNTQQFTIENDGTGPALVVNQLGSAHIAQFMDDSNVVMLIKDGGQTAFGSFGSDASNASWVQGLVYIENPAASNQHALSIKQLNHSYNILDLTNGSCNVVVSGTGRLGLGTASPSAQVDLVSTEASTPLLRLKNTAVAGSEFNISAGGRVGINTSAPTSVHLFVNGICQANTIQTSYLNAASNNLINVNNNTLSNVNVLDTSTLVVKTLSTPSSANGVIDATKKTLSNLSFLKTDNVTTGTLLSTTNIINVSKTTLSNIASVKADSVETTTLTSTGSTINVSKKSLSNISYVKSDSLETSTVTSLNNLINMSRNTLSNISFVKTSSLETSAITSLSNLINMSRNTLSNLALVQTDTLETSVITSTGPTINFNARTLSNVGAVITPLISGTGEAKELRMNFSRILDVDQLIVRSNIAVLLTGTDTYSNLPTDLVRLDSNTGRILDAYLSSNIVRLMTTTGLINPALIPTAETGRNTLLHTRDKVGIGLRNPQQKLHVHGNQVITSGRLGIGTTTPLHAFHLYDDNSSISAFCIDAYGSTDVVRVSSNTDPLLYVTANKRVGVRTANPLYELHVEGTAYAPTMRTNTLTSDYGSIDCTFNVMSNIQSAVINELVITGSIVGNPTVLSGVSNIVATDTITSFSTDTVVVTNAVHITGSSSSLYSEHEQLIGSTDNAAEIGIKIDNSVLAKTLLTISDQRAKRDITVSDADSDLMALLQIPVKRFGYHDRPNDMNVIGFVAQDVEQVAPYAVNSTTAPVPTIMTTVPILDNHTIKLDSADTYDPPVSVNTVLKALHGQDVLLLRVTEVGDGTVCVQEELPLAGQIFIYGPVVPDFKLLNSERLLPLVFNSVKKLYVEQQTIIDRLTRLESAFTTMQ